MYFYLGTKKIKKKNVSTMQIWSQLQLSSLVDSQVG